jgi:hypothetical protein
MANFINTHRFTNATLFDSGQGAFPNTAKYPKASAALKEYF